MQSEEAVRQGAVKMWFHYSLIQTLDVIIGGLLVGSVEEYLVWIKILKMVATILAAGILIAALIILYNIKLLIMETGLAGRSLQIKLLVQGPGEVESELVAAGFFELADKEVLIGGAKQLNDMLSGKVMEYRTNGSFLGLVGEAFLFMPEKDTIPGDRVLLVGLGNRDKISLDIVRLVAVLALEKAPQLGLKNFAFAPEIRDGNVYTLGAGEVAQAASEAVLLRFKEIMKSEQITVATCFMLAGKAHEADARAGIQRATGES